MVVYTVSYPPRLVPVSLVLPTLDETAAQAPGLAPTAAPPATAAEPTVKVRIAQGALHAQPTAESAAAQPV